MSEDTDNLVHKLTTDYL